MLGIVAACAVEVDCDCGVNEHVNDAGLVHFGRRADFLFLERGVGEQLLGTLVERA